MPREDASGGWIIPKVARGQLPTAGLCHQPGIWQGHVAGKPKQDEQPDGQIGRVDLPPAMAVPGRARIGVVVVVPTLTVAEQPDQSVA